MWTARRLAIMFVLGGIFGALCDQLHTQLGVLYYRAPVLFGQAWWVPLLFGAATISIFLGASAIVRRTGREGPPESRDFVIASLWFFGAYVASCFSFDH